VVILVLLAAIIGGVVYAVTQHQGGGRAATGSGPSAPAGPAGAGPLPPPPAAADLRAHLDRWREAGLISADQAAAIDAHEAAALAEARAAWLAAQPPPAIPRRVPVVAEALGYLGGALAVAGLGLVLSRFWPDWSVGARFGVSAATAALLTAGGVAVREQSEPALARLRAVLWLASTAATGLAAGVLVRDGLTEPAASRVALGVALAVTLQSGALWRGRVERPLQQLTCLAGGAVALGTLVAQTTSEGPVGLVLVAVGVAVVALNTRRALPNPELVDLVAGPTALVGAVLTSNQWTPAGMLLGLAVAFALLAVAMVPGLAHARSDRLVTAGLGAFALLELAPGTMGYFAEQAGIATGLVAWAVGAGVVAIGARRLVLAPHVAVSVGAVGMLAGAAVTGTQSPGLATTFGIATALGLVAAGMLPGQVLLSVFGAAGLLGFVPWAITWYFPGEGRVPVLILVSGVLILAVAVLLARLGPRFRQDLRSP
jgi:hypothetical protein